MISILEGADAVGKSTHAHWIFQRDGSTLFHYGVPNGKHPLEEYVVKVAKYANVVMDRSFIGSKVWSKLGFHRPTLNQSNWELVCLWYANQGARVDIIVRPYQEINDTIQRRGESNTDAYHAMMGQREFLKLAIRGDILYMPVTVVTSNLLKQIRKGTT